MRQRWFLVSKKLKFTSYFMQTLCQNFKIKHQAIDSIRKELVGLLEEIERNDSSEVRNRAENLLATLEDNLAKLREEFAGHFSLFGVLLYPERTAERLERLKQTSLWDEEKGLWIGGVDEYGDEMDDNCYTKDQLLYLHLLIALGEEGEAKVQLERLKQTNLWDARKEQWVRCINENGFREDTARYIQDQFVYLRLLVSLDEDNEAEAFFTKLKQTNFWDEETGLCVHRLLEDGGRGYNYFSDDQLLHLRLLIALGEKEEAQAKFVSFKQTRLWNKKDRLWTFSMNKVDSENPTGYYIDDQLAHLHLMVALGKDDDARRHIARLKKTKFWNERNGLWIKVMGKRGGLHDTTHYAAHQLSYLYLLAALGEKDEARAYLEKLKQTNLWDKETGQWIESIREDGSEKSTNRNTCDQLLGALVEGLVE